MASRKRAGIGVLKLAVRRKSRRKTARASNRNTLAKTKKKVRAVAKAAKKSRATRKLPKLKISPKRKAKKSKKLPRPLFRRHIIQGRGGQLVKIMEPIGYQDYKSKFRRLIRDPRYAALKRDFPYLTYSIFGNPGNHRASDLEALIAFFETVYAPTLTAINSSQRKRSEFFGNLVIYGVKRSYRLAPPLKNAHGRKRKKTYRSL